MSAIEQHIEGPGGILLGVVSGAEHPHSQQCEEMLLAAVLADDTGKAWAIAQACGVKPKAFYFLANERIWTAICDLRKRGEQVVDLAIVAEELKLRGQLEPIGGYAYLAQVTAATATSLHTRFCAETLVLIWHQRHLLHLAGELREIALEFKGREAFVEKVGKVGQSLIRLGRREQTKSLFESYDEIREESRARVEGTVDRTRWVRTGLPTFDRECKEMGSRRADGYVVLAGGSGDGKTTAMCQIAGANLEDGKRVLMYSREVDIAGFIEKLVSARTDIDLNLLEQLPKPDAERFYAECDRQRDLWADKKLWCVQQEAATPIYTVEDVCDHARAFVHLHGVPELIMVDYLQIFDARKRIGGQNRESVVAHVSHTLQALQRELGCVMIVGAQLNESGLREMREVKRDEDGKPRYRYPNRGDLRESQAAYHDADRVIFLFRPPVDEFDNDQHVPGLTDIEVQWYQEKRRAGGINRIRTRFQKRFCRFVECKSEGASYKHPVEKTPGAAAGGVDFKKRLAKSAIQSGA